MGNANLQDYHPRKYAKKNFGECSYPCYCCGSFVSLSSIFIWER